MQPFGIGGKAKPKLADVQCSRMQFQPGDRILVRVYRALSEEEEKKLRKSVERWSGGITEVLVINGLDTDVTVEKGVSDGSKILLP